MKTPGRRPARTGRTWFLLLAIILFALAASNVAQAALQFDVFLGYDGTVREASWFPIVCEIKNDGPPFKGAVEVAPDAYGKGQTQVMEVELPTGTLKRITIPAFASGRYLASWNVRLVDERGKTRAEQAAIRPRRQIGWEIPLLGSLSRTASGAPQIRPVPGNQPDVQPATARFLPAVFPDNPLVLEGVNAIYLSSEVASSLQNQQINALLTWINGGGHLIVAVEQVSDITAAPWLRSALPCDPKDQRVLSRHPEIQEWLRSSGSPTKVPAGYGTQPGTRQRNRNVNTASGVSVEKPFADSANDSGFELADLPALTSVVRDGRVVLSSGDTPLIVTANRGHGRITALLFSPEREPFKSWKNLPTFWARLAEVPGHFYVSDNSSYHGYGQSADGIFGAMIDSRQVHKLPIGWLLLLLLIYLVVIGPFDQWWLKKIGRPMLTWITFPCYVVLFSLVIYFIGYKLRAGEAEYNELHVVDVLPNGERAELRGRTYASIYSPSNEKYPVESKQTFATFRGEFVGSSGGQGTERATVLQSGDSFKAEVFVPVWTSQLYVSDWWQGAAMPLTVKVAPNGENWNVTVQNGTDRPAQAAQLVIEDSVISLGEVPANQSKTFNVSRQSGLGLRDFAVRYGSGFQNAVQQRQYAFGQSKGGQISDLANASVAASFVTQAAGRNDYNNYMNFVVPPRLDLSDIVDRGTAELLVWMPDHAPVKPMNQFKTKRGFRHTLWRIPVSVSPEAK